MPKVYAFDVDETLACAGGPVALESLKALRTEGHVVGLCGNVHAFCSRTPGWWDVISFTLVHDGGPWGCLPKGRQLEIFKKLTYPFFDEYVMVGNIKGVTGSSDDEGAAKEAGWRFISEGAFAEGKR